MRTPQVVKLPTASVEYDVHNERTTRRTTEQAFEDLRSDVFDSMNSISKEGSLSIKRHQFLLMGA